MSLKLFTASPRNTGKTSISFALAEILNAFYIPWKLSNYYPPMGYDGPFVIDELSRQSTDIQRWILHNLLRYDFYLFCDSADVKSIHPPLQRFLANHYPEAFL